MRFTAVQALLGNQIHFIFSVGPQMPSIREGSDIILLAQQIGRHDGHPRH